MAQPLDQRRQALDAVARRFSAAWTDGGGAPDAWLTLANRRIAVQVAVVASGSAASASTATPRLRFDRVALRLIDELRAACQAIVPDGQAVILTVTAPIRTPARAAAAVTAMVRELVASGAAPTGVEGAVCGNRVWIRRLSKVAARAPRFLGFVHTPGRAPDAALDLAESLLARVGAAAADPALADIAGPRWLVIASAAPLPVEAWRRLLAQLAPGDRYDRVLLAGPGGVVEDLAP